MKKEQHILIVSMIINFIITVIKIIGGIIFNISSLMSDGLHSLCDFITNMLSLIAAKISKKRANKKYPFGYGRIEYITNMLVGVVVFLLGIFILLESFHVNNTIPNINIIFLLLLIIILKLIVVCILFINGKKKKNNLLLSNAKESITDLYSSIAVLIATILVQFSDKIQIFIYSNNICNVLICILVFKVAFKILYENFISLLGNTEDNKQIEQAITEIISDIKDIELKKITLMKFGTYYSISISIGLNPNIKLKKVFIIENEIKQRIKKSKLGVKYIDINIEPNGEEDK